MGAVINGGPKLAGRECHRVVRCFCVPRLGGVVRHVVLFEEFYNMAYMRGKAYIHELMLHNFLARIIFSFWGKA